MKNELMLPVGYCLAGSLAGLGFAVAGTILVDFPHELLDAA